MRFSKRIANRPDKTEEEEQNNSEKIFLCGKCDIILEKEDTMDVRAAVGIGSIFLVQG